MALPFCQSGESLKRFARSLNYSTRNKIFHFALIKHKSYLHLLCEQTPVLCRVMLGLGEIKRVKISRSASLCYEDKRAYKVSFGNIWI